MELLPVVKIHSVHSAINHFLNFHPSLFLSGKLLLLLVVANLLYFKNLFVAMESTYFAKLSTCINFRFFYLSLPLKLLIMFKRAAIFSKMRYSQLLVLLTRLQSTSVWISLRLLLIILLTHYFVFLFVNIKVLKIKIFHGLIRIYLVYFYCVHYLLLGPLFKLLFEYFFLLCFVVSY